LGPKKEDWYKKEKKKKKVVLRNPKRTKRNLSKSWSY